MTHSELRAPRSAEVWVVGAGPTGLTLAAELALAGVEVAVVERRVDASVAGARAGGLHARTIELFDQRGIAERFVLEGRPMLIAGFASTTIDLAGVPTRYPYVLSLLQEPIERTLAAWAAEHAVPIHRGLDVVGLTEDADGVSVALSDGATCRARYLVGCDGGRSIVRKLAAIDFPGWEASVSYIIAEAKTTQAPPFGIRLAERGVHAIGPLGEGVRIVLVEPEVRHGESPSVDELRAALVSVYGTDFGVHDVTWISRFSDATRQAARYRAGRVMLAGDAAHVHSPAGGQGLNLGVHDAMNLGWKLARVVRGTAPDTLLDSYHAERHPAGARVLEITKVATALQRGDERTKAVREAMAELLAMEAPRQHWGAKLSGLDVRYDLGEGHPLLGRRVPDLDLVTDDGPVRVFSLLRGGSALLLSLGGPPLSLGAWASRARHVVARTAGPWTLPILGVVSSPTAVLVRPDGYVAWVGEGSDQGLRAALARWLGAAEA